ncbi:hypothetical protein [Pseudomonas gingeri]|uniref:Uncharacterized protein n=1 Tax=Pseudomonas gingeri TaxID=117681 RepID=A0A7Y7WU02_9PSED|nr:hypothetical protein [Pseudomonas gingeri]NWB87265.1 hypothetical protein [Pseudomonas gingeri]
MAWFHFCTANHHEVGKSTLVDMADWFQAGLLELGHKVTFSRTHVEKSAINIFWEYFEPGMLAEIVRSKIDYGIIATEIPDGKGFNWRDEPEWVTRFQTFAEVARNAKFIWTMVESSVPFYSRFCPAAYIELGFSEHLIPASLNKNPTVDFCFFGLRTPYREKVVEQLGKHASVEWPQNFLSPAGVIELIGNSRIGLNFKQSAQWPIPSPTRLGRLMMAKRVVAAEYVPVFTRQGEIAGICPETIPFHEYALSLLNFAWRQRADAVFERYKATLPMKLIMEKVLDSTMCYPVTPGESGAVPLKLLPPMLVGENAIWNFVCWGGEYFSIKKELGVVDVTLGLEALQKKYHMKNILHAENLLELHGLVDMQ